MPSDYHDQKHDTFYGTESEFSTEPSETVPIHHTRFSQLLLGLKSRPVPDAPGKMPEHRANIFSRIIWSWLSPLMYTGFNRSLEFNDVYELDERDKMDKKMRVYREKVKEYKEKGSQSPHMKAIFYITRRDLLIGSLFIFLSNSASICMSVVQKMLLKLIKRIYEGEDDIYGKAVGYAVAHTLLLVFYMTTHVWSIYKLSRYEYVLRNTLVTAIHDKTLKLSAYGRAQYLPDHITSLISVDTPRLALAGRYLLNGFIMLPLVGVAIGLLIWYIGAISLIGDALMFVGVCACMVSGRYIKKYRKRANVHADKRVATVRDSVAQMNSLKLYGWEAAFENIAAGARKLEEHYMVYIMRITAAASAAIEIFPSLAGLMVFAIMSKIYHELEASKIFPAVSLYSTMSPMTSAIISWFVRVADAYPGFNRLELFLEADENYEYIEAGADEKRAVSIVDGSFKWLSDLPKPAQPNLRQRLKIMCKLMPVPERANDPRILDGPSVTGVDSANLEIAKGELVVVVGAMGSGKSSLLRAIAGHMIKTGGSLEINGAVSAVLDDLSFNTSVRDNIVFGEPYDAARYKAVVRACALARDINMFENGDLTDVGEKGTTLSGGQKIRLALARGCYSPGDIVLLDDVFSSVDGSAGKTIMDKCVMGLLSTKTRIVVTHNPKHLELADKIVFMVDGKLRVGTLEQLKSNPEFTDYLNETFHVEDEVSTNIVENNVEINVSNVKPSHRSLMTQEGRTRGPIGMRVITSYLKFTGYPVRCFLMIISFIILMGAFNVMKSIFLSWWSADRYHKPRGWYTGIYAAIVVSYCLIEVAFWFTMSRMLYRATSRLHNAALRNVYRAPLLFFDTNPIGRIVNRFGNDLAMLDTKWYDQFNGVIPVLSSALSEYVLLFVYVPWSIIGVVPIVVVGAASATYYRYSGTELNRLMNLYRGSQMSRITENIDGADVVVGYGRQSHFIQRVYHATDRTLAAMVLNQGSIFWLASHVVLTFYPIDFIVVMLCCFRVVKVSPATAGLLFSTLPSACMSLIKVVLIGCETEKCLNYIERLYEYAEEIPQETQDGITRESLGPWPSKGEIAFENVCLRYNEASPLALDNLNFKINAGEKVGVCGPTGAGKSSLLTCLFRLTELSGGKITIDGVDISTIELETLRADLSVVPQSAALFKGTIRSNLDIRGEFNDVELWNTIKLSGATFKLDDEVAEDGANLSMGEQQLLNFCRALVKRSKIIALDEAVASVDPEKYHEIQKVIAQQLQGSTVICIAHRLQSIIGYDRIIVIDQGRIVEMGAPIDLFNANGLFKQLCGESGIDSSIIVNATTSSG